MKNTSLFSFIEAKMSRLSQKSDKKLYYKVLANLKELENDYLQSSWNKDASRSLFISLFQEFHKRQKAKSSETRKTLKKVVKDQTSNKDNLNVLVSESTIKDLD